MSSDDQAAGRKRKIPWRVIAGATLLVALALFFFTRGEEEGEPFRTASATRGEIVRAVSATGQLQPVVAVEVGSTVSGPIETVEVDFNDQVQTGQVLARIDPETFQQRARQLEAQLNQAVASRNQAQAELARYERLAKEGFASEQLLLQQRTELERQQASVALAQAQLAAARVDLDRTIIRSPVNGVVVERAVDPGQTVAASFSAPKLFVIAQDLSKLEAAILVDEADIGEIVEGMPVRFTVDAYPEETFEGTVSQVRKQGAQTSGVVNYTVIVLAENPRGRLLPGMTANAEIVIEEKENALRAPNAAVRFTPGDPKLQAEARTLMGEQAPPKGQGGASQGRKGEGRGQRQLDRLAQSFELTPAQREQAQAAMEAARAGVGGFPGADASEAERRAFTRKMREATQRALEPILTAEQKERLAAMRSERETGRAAVLWLLRDGRPTPVQVRLGVTADAFTEILSGVEEGDLLIVGGGPAAPASGGGMGGAPGMRVRGV